jgi:hypothetical protein
MLLVSTNYAIERREDFAAQPDQTLFKLTPSFTRQQWLEDAVKALRDRFAGAGYVVPERIRYSIGFAKRKGCCGECWMPDASSDRHFEMFISPETTTGMEVVATGAHELLHTVTPGCGHGAAFKQCALKIGLRPPMRVTPPGPEFVAWAEELFKRIGPYPAGYLTDTPKQSTRLLKCACATCGYPVRVTNKWLVSAGPPICPTCKTAMSLRTSE